MMTRNEFQKRIVSLLLVIGLLSVTGLLLGVASSQALGSAPASGAMDVNAVPSSSTLSGDLTTPNAACSGGPVIDGVTLDECVDNSFTVGATTKTVRVWYTKNVSTVQRAVDGVTYNLTHYINSDAEAQDVAQWGREAWERYYQVFNHHPYDTGCGDRINVQLEQGVGWAGIAYWGNPGSCRIGIDAPMIRSGTGQDVVYHEFQHYLQYSFNSGCYGYLRPNYDADAEFVEGYADIAMDTVDPALDLLLFNNFVASYNPAQSFYDKGYWDVFLKYFTEQLGVLYSSTDPQWHFDAVRRHYEMCDAQDTLYVLDDLVPSLKPGLSEEGLFMDFFAANWAHKWADPTTQPELVYFDEQTGPSYGSITLYKDVNISSGTQSWAGETTPDHWAARYFQVKPQSGCAFVTAKVDGAAGAHLGINLMAADTSAPTSVNRTAWIGEDLSRTYPGYGTYDRIAAVVNAFANNASYDVSFSCVTPVLDILEPRQANFALVGDPTSPIAFLARFKVMSDGVPVRGLTESLFTADAEGGAVTIVPGSLSQTGEEYWAIMVPPTKPAGTTFVDLKICLSGSICDTETHALLYVDPGNTDFALVFDGSGSMSTEDVAGEGTRVENAKKAGTVLADLLRVGDRILVTDFSARDIPAGCGDSDHNCQLDLITRLPRTEVTAPASSAIAATKAAIYNVTPREWTPIGAALRDAKDQLLAATTNTNPKHIILLSDGEENVNPMYTDVQSELIASGVVIDTIRFSTDAPGALLAQIASDTGGSYRYVPTTSGTMEQTQQLIDQLTQLGIPSDQINQLTAAQEQSIQQVVDQVTQLGVPPDLISRPAANLLPGPLGLDDVYDYYETQSQSAARLTHWEFLAVPDMTYKVVTQYVDPTVNTLRFVVAGKQGDDNYCGGYVREVDIQPPSEARYWFPISPPDKSTPLSWDIRHSDTDDVVLIPSPESGEWKIRSRYVFYGPCTQSGDPVIPETPSAFESDFIINASAETYAQLSGRFLPPIVNNVGAAGQYVPMVGTLLYKTGAVPGAIVLAWIQRPGVIIPDGLLLVDDGLHNDGAAGDGIYGNEYRTAVFGGTYNVRMIAYVYDAVAGKWATREWNGSFYMTPDDNPDGDFMPAAWELQCGLDPNTNDATLDKDQDGLINGLEYWRGTLPCQADTDHGGERDGSECNVPYNEPCPRNPFWAPDDLVRPLGHLSVVALNENIRIQWTHPYSYTNMLGWIGTALPITLTNPIDFGNSGIYTATLPNGDYFVQLEGQNGDALGDFSDVIAVSPRPDPDAPSGAIMINSGDSQTSSREVILSLSSSDTALGGATTPASGGGGGPLALKYNEVSAAIEVRISNDPNFAGAVWEPLIQEKPWTLALGPAGLRTVYAQFRDGAGNESFSVLDTIEYNVNTTYLSLINR
jgi:hypothetical protein